jgi:hypothetical protein
MLQWILLRFVAEEGESIGISTRGLESPNLGAVPLEFGIIPGIIR